MVEEKEMNGKKWCQKVDSARDKMKKLHTDYAERAEDHYFNDIKKSGQSLRVEVPLFWSNTQVLRSTIFAKNPIPEIRRRVDSEDPTTKDLADMLEKAISYQVDQADFFSDANRAILDYLITDKGIVRIRYDVQTDIVMNEFGSPMVDEKGEPMEEIIDQNVILDHWPWNRFVYDVGKDWAECGWINYDHYLTKSEIKKQFKVDMDNADIIASQDDKTKANKIHVYEIWDKKKRMVYEIAEGRDEPLRIRKDPLSLIGFFDCPKPMISNMRTDKFIGYPDFMMIEPQLNTVNMLQARINKLTKTIKNVGFHEESFLELKELANAADGQSLPVKGLIKKMEGRDLSSAIVKLPIDGAAMVVQILQQLMEKSVQQIYEITGLSDIIRGSTKASETATAQQIKAQYANVRLQDKINTINTMFREVMRMFSEVISEHFKPEILTTMTGVQVTPQMQQLMLNDLARSFSIDVETDSTIAMDEQADKQSRNEMLQSVTAYLQQVGQAKQAGLITADIAKELLLINVRGYKHAKNLEDMVQSMDGSAEQMQQMQQQLQQMQQQAEQSNQQAIQQIQQLTQQLQQAQGQIQQFNQQEEQRKNIETQGEAQKDQAQAQKEMAQAGKLAAETNKINMEAQTMGYQPMQVGL